MLNIDSKSDSALNSTLDSTSTSTLTSNMLPRPPTNPHLNQTYIRPEQIPQAPQAPRGSMVRPVVSSIRRRASRHHQLHAAVLSSLVNDEYGDDILNHMLDMEVKTLPDVQCIDIQVEIKWYMRPFLLDFLTEAQLAFGLLPETLHLAINILDRYCSKRVVYRKHYQLVGCTALLIAAKYGECSKRIPRIVDLAKMCCNLYDKIMFVQMEKHVLTTLDHNMGHPTVDAFLNIFLAESPGGVEDVELKYMALYVAEIALYFEDFVALRASELAKMSLAIGRMVLGLHHDEWTLDYDAQVVLSLSQHLHRPSKILYNKYATSTCWSVSTVLQSFMHAQNAARTVANPPLTPPCERVFDATLGSQCDTPSPSKKRKYTGLVPEEPMTPPITPEGEDVDYVSGRVSKRSFTTPAPPMQPLVRLPSKPPSLPHISSFAPLATSNFYFGSR